MWGPSLRQRLRLLPLFCALRAAETLRKLARRPRRQPVFQPGISIVIPDRDAPDMLRLALQSADDAGAQLNEPCQVFVVANGAPRERYSDLRAQFPHVEWVHSDAAWGFSAAIACGLVHAGYNWSLLFNNEL